MDFNSTETLCDCRFFASYLMSLTFRNMSKGAEIFTWTSLKKILKEYRRTLRQCDGTHNLKMCSQKLCSGLLNNLKILRRDGMEISTLLITAMSAICMRENFCFSVNSNRRLRSFLRQSKTIRVFAAFRENSNFMQLLVINGLVSSLPEESNLLIEETQKIIKDFM